MREGAEEYRHAAGLPCSQLQLDFTRPSDRGPYPSSAIEYLERAISISKENELMAES